MLASAQYIDFEFAHLPSRVPSVARSTGRAKIGFDGRGLWWIEKILLFARRPNDAEEQISREDLRFLAISKALDVGRAEEIAEQINDRLSHGGAHMALFGEHRPNDTSNRSSPPYAGRLRRAA